MNQPLILICGVANDPLITATVAAARSMLVRHLWVDQMQSLNANIDYCYTTQGVRGTLSYHGMTYQLGSITGIFARMIDADSLPEFRLWSLCDKQRHTRFHHQLSAWIDVASARVVNPPQILAGDLPPSAHLQMIRRFFRVPDSLLTNDRAEALRFVRKHERVVVKKGRTTALAGADPESGGKFALSSLGGRPVLLQRWLPGTDVPVFTVGARCFAFLEECANGVCSGVHDAAEPANLPAPVADCCVRLTRALKLPWARVNLRIAADGNYYCLGIDTDPAISYFSVPYAEAIAYSMVEYLAGLS